MTWITLWRPPSKLRNEYGQPHGDNVCLVYIDKAKPKGVSFRGDCKIFFDWKKNRYFEQEWGANFYAFEQPKGSDTPEQMPDAEQQIDFKPEETQEEIPF
jgi:hypothetical protein